MVMSFRITKIDDVPSAPTDVDGLDWRPVRHHLGIAAFGTNAYVGREVGDLVIEPHDEDTPHEELYVVVSGAARFVVDDEPVDAPAGSLLLVTPPSRRVAHATEPGTAILVVGGAPGQAFAVSDWEERWLAAADRGEGPTA